MVYINFEKSYTGYKNSTSMSQGTKNQVIIGKVMLGQRSNANNNSCMSGKVRWMRKLGHCGEWIR